MYQKKESLHIICMSPFLFGIITLNSLTTRIMIIRKRTIKKVNRLKFSIIQDNHFDVVKREFPICDVQQGLIGDLLVLSKSNPPV